MSEIFYRLNDGLRQDTEHLETMFYRFLRQANAMRDLVTDYTRALDEAEHVLRNFWTASGVSETERQSVYDCIEAIRKVRAATEKTEQEIQDGRLGIMAADEAVRLGLLPDPSDTVASVNRRGRRRKAVPVDFNGCVGVLDTSDFRD